MSICVFCLKVIKRSNNFFYRLFHFGFIVTFIDYFFEITKFCIISPIKHKVITNWLQKKFRYFISMHCENRNSLPRGEIPKQIWLCWWDGIDMMPPIVRACYNSVIRYSNDFKVTVITKYNYVDYIFIPEYVMKKVNNGKMTLTHFSNIVRMALLYNHGGFWLDATFLVTNTIILDNNFFFTIRRNSNWKHVANGRWTGCCIAGVPNYFLFKFIYEFLCEYWKKYNRLITYHLYDYSINLAYESFPEIKMVFDSICPNNINNTLVNYLKDKYDPVILENIVKDTIFHKLTWKHNCQTVTANNKLTLYGHILEHYK